ncbi:MAG: hypothetical protein ACRCT8_04070 [Lacipirellulaceae bacterium]
MRLTLRTLLAYLDDVLEPAERQQLQQQIDASDFAKELVHRTGDVTRMLRLGAPDPLSASPLDDANTVAEYLDSTLEPERMAEFERACLESDTLLAEAAACHHVLTMVLNRPAEVDPDTLKRMHALEDALRRATRLRIEPSHRARAAEPAVAERVVEPASSLVSASQPAVGPVAPRVPDYLQASRPSPWGVRALAAAALLLLAAVGYRLYSPVEGTLAKAEPGNQADDPARGESAVEPAPAAPDPGAAEVATGAPQAPATQPAATQPAAAQPPTSQPLATVEPTPPLDGPKADAPAAAGRPAAEPGDEAPATDSGKPGETAPSAEGDDAIAAPAAPEPPAVARPTTSGKYLGPVQSLLVEEREAGSWWRLSPGGALGPRTRLVSLPTYRPMLDIVGPIDAELVGSADVTIDVDGAAPLAAKDTGKESDIASEKGEESDKGSADPTDDVMAVDSTAAAVPQIEVRYGNVLLMNLGEAAPAEIALVIGDQRGRVRLAPGASLALAVERAFMPGLELREESPPVLAIAYAPQGNVTWGFRGADLSIDEPSQWMIVGEGGLKALAPYAGDPGWIDPSAAEGGVTVWDADASGPLVDAVPPGSEAWPALQGIKTRRKELRGLADRCSAVVGHPESLVATFDSGEVRSQWRTNLDELRRVASRDPAEAQRVYDAFVAKYGIEPAAVLWKLLCGFSAEEIGLNPDERATGGVVGILTSMESESLPERALANLNLEEITGYSQVYSAIESAKRRRAAIGKLRRQLENGDLHVLMAPGAPTAGGGS